MDIVRAVFQSIATVVSVYSTICLIRIFLTWIPQLNYSRFGQFMSAICDPFLNIFSKIPFLRIGMIDFSPIVAFALLSAIASVCNRIAKTGTISFSYVLGLLLVLLWNTIEGIIILLVIMLVIRLILILAKRGSYGFWSQIDSMIFRISMPIKKLFWKEKYLGIMGSTIIALIQSVLICVAGRVALHYLLILVAMIPF